MIIYKPFLFFCFFSLLAMQAVSQTKTIETLKRNVLLAKSEEAELSAIFALCELGYILHPDTLMFYTKIAEGIAAKLHNQHARVRAMYFESGALTTKGLIDSSLAVANNCLQLLSDKIKDPNLQANVYNQKGRCFMRKNQYKEAIEMGYKVINGGEYTSDILLQIKGKTLVGWAYLEMGQTAEALNWHLKAMHTTTDTTILQKYAILFANLALNYSGLGKQDSAFYFINKAITYARRNENLFALSNSLAICAQLLVRSGNAPAAESRLKEVIQIRKLIGDPFYIVSDMGQLGLYYAGNVMPEKGIAICNEGILVARNNKIDTKLLFLYSSLAENYKVAGDMEKYAAILEKIIALKDSVFQKNSAMALAEMQTKYETEKNANIIAQQKLAIAKKNYWLYGSIVFMLLGLLILFIIFTNYRKKEQLKNALLLKEEKYLSEQAIASAEENERKRIALDLHDNIGAYASAISADIEKITLNGIEKNSLSLQNLQSHSKEIINSLRDTIWVLNKENITITGISDRIKIYISKMELTYDHIDFSLHDDIGIDARISSKHALNIFRIVQEAVHNAVKHGNAAHIEISICSHANIVISITDDGKGMEGQQLNAGYGLQNMKARAKENSMTLSIHSIPGKGTVLSIETGTTN